MLRSQQVANSPEIIRRLGIIAMNTPLEVDIVGSFSTFTFEYSLARILTTYRPLVRSRQLDECTRVEVRCSRFRHLF
jgi:hypothetical protein